MGKSQFAFDFNEAFVSISFMTEDGEKSMVWELNSGIEKDKEKIILNDIKNLYREVCEYLRDRHE